MEARGVVLDSLLVACSRGHFTPLTLYNSVRSEIKELNGLKNICFGSIQRLITGLSLVTFIMIRLYIMVAAEGLETRIKDGQCL